MRRASTIDNWLSANIPAERCVSRSTFARQRFHKNSLQIGNWYVDMQTRRKNRSVAPRWRASARGLCALKQKKKKKGKIGQRRRGMGMENAGGNRSPKGYPFLEAWQLANFRRGLDTRVAEPLLAPEWQLNFYICQAREPNGIGKKEKRKECRPRLPSLPSTKDAETSRTVICLTRRVCIHYDRLFLLAVMFRIFAYHGWALHFHSILYYTLYKEFYKVGCATYYHTGYGKSKSWSLQVFLTILRDFTRFFYFI